VNDPRFGGGSGGRGANDSPGRPGEWAPPGRSLGDDEGGYDFGDGARRRHGWSSPGGRPEWRPVEEGRDGERGRRGWGDDGGFRGKPL
jgi:hypothetical protein